METTLEEFFEKENWFPKEVQEMYLAKEKQQIIDAWKDGCYNERGNFPKRAEEYFNITFKK